MPYACPKGPVPLFRAFESCQACNRPNCIEFGAPGQRAGENQSTRVFRYTLKLLREIADAFPDVVGYEALHGFPRGRPRRLIERRSGKPLQVAKNGDQARDVRLVEPPANASVLSILARLETSTAIEIVTRFSHVKGHVGPTDPVYRDADDLIRFFRENPNVKERLSDKIRRLGIENMNIQQRSNGTWALPIRVSADSSHLNWSQREHVHLYASLLCSIMRLNLAYLLSSTHWTTTCMRI